MTQVITFDPPTLPDSLPDETILHRERRAFVRLLPELLKTCRGQYVAIHGGKVVEHGPDEIDVLRRVYDRLGSVPMWLARVEEEPPVVRIPHYRVLGEPRNA